MKDKVTTTKKANVVIPLLPITLQVIHVSKTLGTTTLAFLKRYRKKE